VANSTAITAANRDREARGRSQGVTRNQQEERGSRETPSAAGTAGGQETASPRSAAPHAAGKQEIKGPRSADPRSAVPRTANEAGVLGKCTRRVLPSGTSVTTRPQQRGSAGRGQVMLPVDGALEECVGGQGERTLTGPVMPDAADPKADDGYGRQPVICEETSMSGSDSDESLAEPLILQAEYRDQLFPVLRRMGLPKAPVCRVTG